MTIRAIIAFVFLLTAAPAHSWRLELLDQPRFIESVEGSGEIFLRAKDGLWRLDLENGKLKPVRIGVEAKRAPEADALPDGTIVNALPLGGIIYLAHPTKRYGHGVLGDAIEADALVLLRNDGGREVVWAGDDAVFEDLTPRLYDLNGDGVPEIVVVKSYLDRGAALAVIGLDGKKLKIIAETPPIGTPNRWLNPAGFGDFSGSGNQEVGFVRMPHALGRLEIWRWVGGKLTNVASVSDTSNHAIGSRSLNLAVVADFDGDSVADIAIPSFDRRAIRILRFRGGVVEIARIRLPSRAERGMALLQSGRDKLLVVGLEDGNVAVIRN